ncbi:MAG: hypothetical protein LBM77_05145 [Spirochaetaceae bacterium]|jgi:hypothetical protein|nr:hypothetical protein [Spirochaetaceae bacterium]
MSFLVGLLLFAFQGAPLSAQEVQPVEPALVLTIQARVLSEGQSELWSANISRTTVPGKPVGVQLQGSNVLVQVSFTPYHAEDGSFMLLAQGQIGVEMPGKGLQYQYTVDSIPVSLGELIYFFPLGNAENASKSLDQAIIEMLVALNPYTQDTPNEEESPDDES